MVHVKLDEIVFMFIGNLMPMFQRAPETVANVVLLLNVANAAGRKSAFIHKINAGRVAPQDPNRVVEVKGVHAVEEVHIENVATPLVHLLGAQSTRKSLLHLPDPNRVAEQQTAKLTESGLGHRQNRDTLP